MKTGVMWIFRIFIVCTICLTGYCLLGVFDFGGSYRQYSTAFLDFMNNKSGYIITIIGLLIFAAFVQKHISIIFESPKSNFISSDFFPMKPKILNKTNLTFRRIVSTILNMIITLKVIIVCWLTFAIIIFSIIDNRIPLEKISFDEGLLFFVACVTAPLLGFLVWRLTLLSLWIFRPNFFQENSNP